MIINAKTIRNAFLGALLLGAAPTSKAVQCGNRSSISPNWIGDLWTVTDCWCKNPCVTWEGTEAVAWEWCNRSQAAEDTRCD